MLKRVKVFLLLALPAALFGLATPGAASAADDFYLQLDGIRGDSSSKEYKDAMEVLSFAWRVDNRDGKRASFGDFNVSKEIDSASPSLMVAVASGQRIANGVVAVTASTGDGGPPKEVQRFCLTGVRITSLASGRSIGGAGTEEVQLAYETITQSVRRQNSDGTVNPTPFTAGWDLVRNLQIGSPVC